MVFFEQLTNEVSNMDLPNFIMVVLLFYIPFYFSKKAQTLFFHLFYAGIGLYMLFTMEDTRIIYDTKMLVGLGLLVPQLTFLRWFFVYSIQTIKMMTSNTYYFFLTIFYKMMRFLKWLISIPNNIKIFFANFSFKKSQNYQEDNKSYENKYKEEYQHKQKKEKSYNEEESKSFYEEKQESYQESKNDYGEFAQFYSDNAYIILGVSSEDDLKTIKKIYIKLANEYHPDKHPEEFELYNEIMGKINEAYSKVKKYNK